MTSLVTVDEVYAARKALSGVTRVTPMEPARGMENVPGPVFLKCENVQRAGAYKVRGAYVRIARLSSEERARGVVAASAGNHAQGVAVAAAALGAKATVFMPAGAPLPKVAATRGYGAHVELIGDTVDECLEAARDFARRTGAVFIHPFDHPDVIAGQGTVALEILEQCPEVKTIVAGVGGGGLISGIGVVCKALRPDVKVIGVQAAGAAAFPPSLKAGRPVRLPSYATIADGIKVGKPGDITFPHVAALVDSVATVSDEDISRAVLVLLERNKLLVEPAGAVGAAALLAGVLDAEPPVVALLSGGNIDPLLLLRLIEHGLSVTGRFLRCTVRCADRPGVLASMLGLIAERGGNVVDVMHQRHDPKLRVGEVSVALSVETRGDDHAAHLLSALRDAGYTLTLREAGGH
ncbi:MAG TPA: threonine ammonia-lyase [Stackebrandtia sp.]|uniref:threonine ammonia-lyase n=1 Tax=Stackebrandtia sp. TaxID=2023065 RepID=UPI002D605454|nr:threonine ammonia-lyase [Stackebrandtia sp.]HZE39269.1 threonine ammonia-lyase [Stackebrandtia sp.]